MHPKQTINIILPHNKKYYKISYLNIHLPFVKFPLALPAVN